MKLGGRREGLILLVGDLLCFTIALWLALFLRYGAWPSADLWLNHLRPFSLFFLLSTLVFFIFDLYRQQTLLFIHSIPSLILRAQFFNVVVIVLAFYFIPYFSQNGLTPKTNLFLYLLISSGLILLWRQYLVGLICHRRSITVRFDCQGAGVEELKEIIKQNSRQRLKLVADHSMMIVVNPYEERSEEQLAKLYQLLFTGVQLVAAQDLYEEIFGRVSLSLVNERWFVERISNSPTLAYDFLKRAMDLVISSILGFLSLPLYPIVWLAIKWEDGGPIFYYDRRVGRHGQEIFISKFRTMTLEPELIDRKITRVGRWLRRTRIDELPQLWNVVFGKQSLVGPRPEKRDYVELYRTRIPFYDARHLIAPGLSGWAQIYQENHPHFDLAEDATREKLSYDLYYVKNRGVWLDITIALKTIKTLLSRRGR